jgi:diadenosine tetraphosphatase ApaH/serine/threonine PP2A family protein phosphatase
MRIAVFSDIHANRQALEAFCEHTASRQIDRYMCLGDIVGYGADPEFCISLVRTLPEIDCVLGNHDHAVAGAPYSMNRDAQKVIEWTRGQLSAANLSFLKTLEACRKWDDLLFCHANPYRPLEWYYVEEREYIARSFARSKAKILFIGHTHVAAAITRQNFFCLYMRTPRNEMVVPAAERNRQIFNCGSIGQPRDGDPRASYLIYDTDRQTVEFVRVAYDYERAAGRIRETGLPEVFAKRLMTGE